MKKLSYEEIFQELYKLLQEKYYFIINYYLEYLKSFNRLNNNTRKKLIDELNNYLASCRKYRNIIAYILIKRKYIDYDDGIYVLDDLDDKFEDITSYMFNILEDFSVANDLRQDYKFQLLNNKSIFLNEEDIINNVNYVKGFNIDRITNFLIDNCIYTLDEFVVIYENSKILNISDDDALLLSGINEREEILLPLINSELTALINIHELVHKALLMRQKSINNNVITYGEDLSIFYELLFQKENHFCKLKIHSSNLAKKLLSTYNGEDFNIQISKLKKLL